MYTYIYIYIYICFCFNIIYRHFSRRYYSKPVRDPHVARTGPASPYERYSNRKTNQQLDARQEITPAAVSY